MIVKAFSLSLFFNGELYTLQTYKLFTLKDLILFLNYIKNIIVIEHNGKITNPKDWQNIILKNNDSIEVVTVVGGG